MLFRHRLLLFAKIRTICIFVDLFTRNLIALSLGGLDGARVCSWGWGEQDHATWIGGEKSMMADWVLDRATSWIKEVRAWELTNRSQKLILL